MAGSDGQDLSPEVEGLFGQPLGLLGRPVDDCPDRAAAATAAAATSATWASADGDTAEARTLSANRGPATRNKKTSPHPVDNSKAA
jgi:hypothetical protein